MRKKSNEKQNEQSLSNLGYNDKRSNVRVTEEGSNSENTYI